MNTGLCMALQTEGCRGPTLENRGLKGWDLQSFSIVFLPQDRLSYAKMWSRENICRGTVRAFYFVFVVRCSKTMEAAGHRQLTYIWLDNDVTHHLTAQGMVSSEFLRHRTLTQKVCFLVCMRSQARGWFGGSARNTYGHSKLAGMSASYSNGTS